jgi:transketolase
VSATIGEQAVPLKTLSSNQLERLAEGARFVPLRWHGVPDEHVPVGLPAGLYAHPQLDAPGIAVVAQELLKGSQL